MTWREVMNIVPLWKSREMIEKVFEERGEKPTINDSVPDWVVSEVDFWR